MRLRIFGQFFVFFLLATCVGHAQYKGDDIPGFLGLQSGTQAPPGLCVGNLVWVYPTDTIKDSRGNTVGQQRASLTSTADLILVNLVTNYKFLGANVGFQAAIPFIKNRLQLNSLDVNTGFAFTDMFVSPIVLGWHRKRADFNAGYNLYMPTGRYSAGGTDNTGLGMWGNEFFVGTTVYLDQKRLWNASGNFALEFHTNKSGTNINVGDMATIQGGVGRTFYRKVSGPIPEIFNLGAAYYAQFKVTGDSGSDICSRATGIQGPRLRPRARVQRVLSRAANYPACPLRAGVRRARSLARTDGRIRIGLGCEITDQTSVVNQSTSRGEEHGKAPN